MAAENDGDGDGDGGARTRFNEAAAHGRGKRVQQAARWPAPRGFNEAAAHGRGKRRASTTGASRRASLQ